MHPEAPEDSTPAQSVQSDKEWVLELTRFKAHSSTLALVSRSSLSITQTTLSEESRPKLQPHLGLCTSPEKEEFRPCPRFGGNGGELQAQKEAIIYMTRKRLKGDFSSFCKETRSDQTVTFWSPKCLKSDFGAHTVTFGNFESLSLLSLFWVIKSHILPSGPVAALRFHIPGFLRRRKSDPRLSLACLSCYVDRHQSVDLWEKVFRWGFPQQIVILCGYAGSFSQGLYKRAPGRGCNDSQYFLTSLNISKKHSQWILKISQNLYNSPDQNSSSSGPTPPPPKLY